MDRRRAPNFSTEEKRFLLNLIKESLHIVENKAQDSANWKRKDKEWKEIAEKFNEQDFEYRTADSIKRFYENRKKEAKKAAGLKSLKTKTEPGDPLAGLKHYADYDQVNDFTEDNDIDFCETTGYNPFIDNGITTKNESTCKNYPERASSRRSSEDQHERKLKKSTTTTNKSHKKSNQLQSQIQASVASSENNDNSIKLSAAKLKLIQLQIEELEEKRKRDAEEFSLRKESLLLDIELKKKKLNFEV